jgi:hypothetical protein
VAAALSALGPPVILEELDEVLNPHAICYQI